MEEEEGTFTLVTFKSNERRKVKLGTGEKAWSTSDTGMSAWSADHEGWGEGPWPWEGKGNLQKIGLPGFVVVRETSP